VIGKNDLMDPISPISKRDFIQIMATGSPLGLVNDHHDPSRSIHPLLYTPDLRFPDLQCVPLLYKVGRGFADAYKEIRR
jgi:hypothetical protein